MRELQKRWTERRKQRNVQDIESSEDSQEDSHLKAKVSHTDESQRRIPIQKKKTEKATSILKRRININLLEETTPVHKSKVKLKQTKLNFQTNEITNSNTNEISLFDPRNRPNNKQLKTAKLITSTPLRVGIKKLSQSPSLETNNITFIQTRTASKLNDSKNNYQLGNKKTQEKNNRLLRKKTKSTELSSQVLKTNPRLTRSMTKS